MIDEKIEITCFFFSNLIKSLIDESISNKSFSEYFKQMLKKLKLMKKSKSRNINFILKISENMIQTKYIFVLKNLRQSNLNFKAKTLIESLFKRLNVLQ